MARCLMSMRRREERGDFVRAENDRESLGLLWERNAVQDVFPSKRDLVEVTQRAERLVVDAPGDFLLLNELEEVGADLVSAKILG